MGSRFVGANTALPLPNGIEYCLAASNARSIYRYVENWADFDGSARMGV